MTRSIQLIFLTFALSKVKAFCEHWTHRAHWSKSEMHIYTLDVKLTQAVWTSIFIYSLLVFLCSQCNLRSSKNPMKINHFSPVQLCLPPVSLPPLSTLFSSKSLCATVCVYSFPIHCFLCVSIDGSESSGSQSTECQIMCKLPHHRLRAPS